MSSLTTLYSEVQTLLSNNAGDIPNTISEINLNLGASNVAKEYFADVTDLILDYDNSNEIDTLIDEIKLVETTILADTSLTFEETQQLLTSASIARFSRYYWFTVYNSDPSNWPTNTGTNRAPFWDWVKEN
ncbi:MAG: hypothetical protein H7296_04030 [Bacteroidia bacterium]|nr:hypothetical protein [Bacteroidia bacterium]